jgi:hypothetical protein
MNEMIQDAMRAICVRPGEDPVRCESRVRQLAFTTIGFEPRDGLEHILATLSFGHFNLILNAIRDVFHAQKDDVKAKSMKTVLGLLQRKRPVAPEAAAMAPGGTGTVPPSRPVPEPPAETAAARPSNPDAPPPKPPGTTAPDAGLETPQPKIGAPPRLPASAPGSPANIQLLDNLIAVLDRVPKPDAGDAAWTAHTKAYVAAFNAVEQSGAFDKAKPGSTGGD